MGRPFSFREFKRVMARFGVTVKQGSKSTHYKLSKSIRGERRVYTIAVHHNEVLDVYIRKTRRVFELPPENGVSDAAFFSK